MKPWHPGQDALNMSGSPWATIYAEFGCEEQSLVPALVARFRLRASDLYYRLGLYYKIGLKGRLTLCLEKRNARTDGDTQVLHTLCSFEDLLRYMDSSLKNQSYIELIICFAMELLPFFAIVSPY
uniref:Uncharacterized protein n=1 Tax=Glossina pallidipes TaxID=7398 RepID=A0A1B0A8Z4_GLOPL